MRRFNFEGCKQKSSPPPLTPCYKGEGDKAAAYFQTLPRRVKPAVISD